MWKVGNLEGKQHAFNLLSEPIIYISAWRRGYVFSFLLQDSDFCEVEWAQLGKM